MNWSGVNTTRKIWVMWIGYLEKLWPWVRLNWWCVAIWCQWIFSSQDRKFWHVTWVMHTHNDQLNASHNGENAKMTHNGILAKQIIRIRLTKSYEVYDFWICLKKRVAHLTPQVFGNSYNWVWKKKDTAWERDTYNIIFVPEIQEHHPKIRIVQFQSLYI